MFWDLTLSPPSDCWCLTPDVLVLDLSLFNPLLPVLLFWVRLYLSMFLVHFECEWHCYIPCVTVPLYYIFNCNTVPNKYLLLEHTTVYLCFTKCETAFPLQTLHFLPFRSLCSLSGMTVCGCWCTQKSSGASKVLAFSLLNNTPPLDENTQTKNWKHPEPT